MINYKYLILISTIKICISFHPIPQPCVRREFLSPNVNLNDKKIMTKTFLSKTDDPPIKGKVKGVYSRPSAAIERGSGFFVPGLEGSKVRVLFGMLVLVLNYVNHIFSSGANINEVTGFTFSERIATFYGVFLLFQGIIEFAKEIGLGFDGVSTTGAPTGDDSTGIVLNQGGLAQLISPSLNALGENAAEGVCWAAASYLALTPATNVMLIESSQTSGDTILYRLGEFTNLNTMSNENIQLSTSAAMETVYQSKGGRISIPSNHPAAELLPESNRRCVLLQQIKENKDGKRDKRRLCLLVGSDKLLATFTKNDLKWLGSLSKYIGLKLR